MTSPADPAEAHETRAAVRRRAAGDLLAGGVVVLVLAVATWGILDLPASYVGVVSTLYAVVVALILATVPEQLPRPGLGLANRVTLLRTALTLPISALALRRNGLGPAGAWWVIGLGTLALVLDGVDGRVARRTSSASPFGARFDMELDAFLILALSVLAWRTGPVGAWVVLIGALRYGFVAGGWAWPALRADLPHSERRRVICVVQGVVLLVCLGPIVPVWLATGSAAGALGVLLYSFGVDAAWLARQGRGV